MWRNVDVSMIHIINGQIHLFLSTFLNFSEHVITIFFFTERCLVYFIPLRKKKFNEYIPLTFRINITDWILPLGVRQLNFVLIDANKHYTELQTLLINTITIIFMIDKMPNFRFYWKNVCATIVNATNKTFVDHICKILNSN